MSKRTITENKVIEKQKLHVKIISAWVTCKLKQLYLHSHIEILNQISRNLIINFLHAKCLYISLKKVCLISFSLKKKKFCNLADKLSKT